MVPVETNTWYYSQILIALNVAVFIVGVGMGDSLFGGGDNGLVEHAATIGGNIHYLDEWWRVITGGFLHHGIFHLGVNMYTLYLLGVGMERWIGQLHFNAVYGASLVSGSFGALIESPNALIAGASGAIFGLLGAYVILLMSQGIGLFQTPIGYILVLNLFISFMVGGISLGGHLGGLVGGAVVGAAIAAAFRTQKFIKVGPVLVAVLVAGASFVGALWAASRSTVVLQVG